MKSLNLLLLWFVSTGIMFISTDLFYALTNDSNFTLLFLVIYVMDIMYFSITFLVFKKIYFNYSAPYLQLGNTEANAGINT